MQGISSVASRNNPVKYVDPDGRILLPILNSEKKNIRKNINRNNKEYRVGSNIDDWKSDKFGRQILLHYLFGNGKELICNSKKWGDYMRANSSFELQIEKAIIPYYDKLESEPGSTFNFNIQMDAKIENGESITGYNYLHGTNEVVGGLQLEVSLFRETNGSITVSYNAQWNDIMDPNPEYDTDIKKAKFANIISFGRCKDYIIRVKWNDIYQVIPRKVDVNE